MIKFVNFTDNLHTILGVMVFKINTVILVQILKVVSNGIPFGNKYSDYQYTENTVGPKYNKTFKL